MLIRKGSSGLGAFEPDEFIMEIEDEDVDEFGTPPKSKKNS